MCRCLAISVIFTILLTLSHSENHLEAYSTGLNDDIMTVCQAFAKVFADAAANYTHCFLINSHPLQLCSACVEEYLVVNQAYDNLETVLDDTLIPVWKTDRKCSKWMMNSDKVMAIQHTKQFFEGLWSSSVCDRCFEYTHWNATSVNYLISPEVTQFHALLANTTDCFKNYMSKNDSGINQSQVCTKCRSIYKSLNKYYETLNDKYDQSVCMDLVDSMNFTRLRWGHEYNCSTTTIKDGLTISLTALFFLLPVIFYVASHIHYERIEQRIERPNRMRSGSRRSETRRRLESIDSTQVRRQGPSTSRHVDPQSGEVLPDGNL